MADLQLPEPLELQKRELADEHRFKLLRWGRRVSKSRQLMLEAVLGRGKPDGERGRNWWPGFLKGGIVYWFSRDNTLLKTLWREEFRPRFKNLHDSIWVSDQEMRIEMRDGSGGVFEMVSAENIDAARGRKADQALVDEAAHFDLEYALQGVIQPMLTDRRGALTFASTTKLGSHFNRLCEMEQRAELGPLWHQSHVRTSDAEHLDPDEVKLIYALYPEESPERQQELDAELLASGGLAFPMWDGQVHAIQWEAPRSWERYWTIDWGYDQFGVAYCMAKGKERRAHFENEFKFKGMQPYEVGYQMAAKFTAHPPPLVMTYDAQMDANTQGYRTILDDFQAGMRELLKEQTPGLVKGPKGPGSIYQRRVLIADLLTFTRDENNKVPEWLAPKLTFHRRCEYAIKTFPRLMLDDKKLEIADGQEDHPFDSTGYLLMFTTPEHERPERKMAEDFKRRARKLNARGTRLLDRDGNPFSPYDDGEEEGSAYIATTENPWL